MGGTLRDSHPDSSRDEKLKNGLGECQVIEVAQGIYFENCHCKTYGEFLPTHN